MSFKTFWRKNPSYHWMVSGLVVFISSITGALYVFKDEIESMTQTFRHVEAEGKEMLLPSEVFKIAEEALPNTLIHGAIYNGSTEVMKWCIISPNHSITEQPTFIRTQERW